MNLFMHLAVYMVRCFSSGYVFFYILQLLIQHHADVNIRDKDGLSPSMWACRLDHIHHFELLSRSENFHVEDADGIERDLIGRTWMHWAVRRLEPLECLQVESAISLLMSVMRGGAVMGIIYDLHIKLSVHVSSIRSKTFPGFALGFFFLSPPLPPI